MPVRYSGARLVQSAHLKQVILAAVAHLTRAKKGARLQDLRATKGHVDIYRRHTLAESWGPCESDVVQALDAPSSPEPHASSSSSDDASSVSSHPSECCFSASVLPWLHPRSPSAYVHVAKAGEVDIAICRSIPFGTGFETGLGVQRAHALGRVWCPQCLAKLPAQLREQCQD